MSSQLDYTCLGNYLVCLIMWIFQSPIYVETHRFYKMMQAKLCVRQKHLSTASYLAVRMDRYWSNHQAMIAKWHLDIGGRCSLYLCSVVTWRMRVCNNNLFSHYILSSEGRKILHVPNLSHPLLTVSILDCGFTLLLEPPMPFKWMCILVPRFWPSFFFCCLQDSRKSLIQTCWDQGGWITEMFRQYYSETPL